MPDTFNPQSYATLPQLDAPGAIALATALQAAAPNPAPTPAIGSALARLGPALAALKLAWKASLDADPANATRAGHGRVDAAWSHLQARLEAYAGLPVEKFPRAGRAAELLTTLLPDGLGFTHKPYKEEWAESEALLQKVGEAGLQPDLDALAGPEFLADLRDAHQAYGAALGITAALSVAHVDVAGPFDALKLELGKYVRAVVSLVDDKPEQAALAKKALAPIETHRAEVHTRKIAASAKAKKAPSPAAAASK